MRRIVVGSFIVLALSAALGATSGAQVTPTISVTPNPVEANADVTIANTTGATCQSTTLQADGAEVGALEGADVVVLLNEIGGPQEIFDFATTDTDGNWQVVVQVPEAGRYTVVATCQLNGVSYEAVTLAVTAGAEPPPTEPPPTEPPPSAPPATPAQPQAQAPAFTG